MNYVAAASVAWVYDKPERMGAKTLLLTIGGICTTGTWSGDVGQYFLAWAPMPKRNHAAEYEILNGKP